MFEVAWMALDHVQALLQQFKVPLQVIVTLRFLYFIPAMLPFDEKQDSELVLN